MIKINNLLDIVNLFSWYLINSSIRKASDINAYLRVFIIKGNLIKDLIKKKALLIIEIDFKSKT